jgi:hypothetical protein
MRCRLGCNPKDNLIQLQELIAQENVSGGGRESVSCHLSL